MEEINEQEELKNEVTPQEENQNEMPAESVETPQEETCQAADDATCPAPESTDSADEATCCAEEETAEEGGRKCKCKNKKLWIILGSVIGVAAIVVIILACLGLFKYPGYKLDRESGIYYKIHGEVNDTAAIPQNGDPVGFMFTLRTKDSTLIDLAPYQSFLDSATSDLLYSAVHLMHVGDSATFIFNGQDFFKQLMAIDYPFDDEPLYMDVKLMFHMPRAEYDKMASQYEQEMRQRKADEQGDIDKFLSSSSLKYQKTSDGIYMVNIKKGSGAAAENGKTLKVHYTGKMLDGTVFDSSVERNEPMEFVYGEQRFIPGWELAISKMHVGDKVSVLLPSDMAYGDRGAGNIPPFTPLIFDIELLEVK